MSDDRILGTRVPDTPIHRASMWLEGMRFGDRREEAGVEPQDEESLRAIAAELGVDAEQLLEAAQYYATNHLNMLIPLSEVRVIITRAGPELHDLLSIVLSIWLDGFLHGAATTAGKTGLSNQEIREARG